MLHIYSFIEAHILVRNRILSIKKILKFGELLLFSCYQFSREWFCTLKYKQQIKNRIIFFFWNRQALNFGVQQESICKQNKVHRVSPN